MSSLESTPSDLLQVKYKYRPTPPTTPASLRYLPNTFWTDSTTNIHMASTQHEVANIGDTSNDEEEGLVVSNDHDGSSCGSSPAGTESADEPQPLDPNAPFPHLDKYDPSWLKFHERIVSVAEAMLDRDKVTSAAKDRLKPIAHEAVASCAELINAIEDYNTRVSELERGSHDNCQCRAPIDGAGHADSVRDETGGEGCDEKLNEVSERWSSSLFHYDRSMRKWIEGIENLQIDHNLSAGTVRTLCRILEMARTGMQSTQTGVDEMPAYQFAWYESVLDCISADRKVLMLSDAPAETVGGCSPSTAHRQDLPIQNSACEESSITVAERALKVARGVLNREATLRRSYGKAYGGGSATQRMNADIDLFEACVWGLADEMRRAGDNSTCAGHASHEECSTLTDRPATVQGWAAQVTDIFENRLLGSELGTEVSEPAYYLLHHILSAANHWAQDPLEDAGEMAHEIEWLEGVLQESCQLHVKKLQILMSTNSNSPASIEVSQLSHALPELIREPNLPQTGTSSRSAASTQSGGGGAQRRQPPKTSLRKLTLWALNAVPSQLANVAWRNPPQ